MSALLGVSARTRPLGGVKSKWNKEVAGSFGEFTANSKVEEFRWFVVLVVPDSGNFDIGSRIETEK